MEMFKSASNFLDNKRRKTTKKMQRGILNISKSDYNQNNHCKSNSAIKSNGSLEKIGQKVIVGFLRKW